MKHQLVYVTGFEDWEMVYLDGQKYLEGHQIELTEVFEMIAGLENPCNITTYEALDLDALEEVELFFYRTSNFEDVKKYLNKKSLFEMRKVV